MAVFAFTTQVNLKMWPVGVFSMLACEAYVFAVQRRHSPLQVDFILPAQQRQDIQEIIRKKYLSMNRTVHDEETVK